MTKEGELAVRRKGARCSCALMMFSNLYVAECGCSLQQGDDRAAQKARIDSGITLLFIFIMSGGCGDVSYQALVSRCQYYPTSKLRILSPISI